MARYRIGNDLTILWKVYDKEGKALFLNDKEVHLFYTCERGRFEADINIQEDNIVVWNFYGSLQKTLGEYSLTLEIFQSEGMRSIKKDVCGAFVFVAKDCEADVKDTTVSLNGEVVAHQEVIKTNLDVCRVSPVIPYVVRDENGIGYWYVDGVNTGDRSTGESAYEYAVSKGYQGTEEEFASILALVPNTLPNKADKTGRYPEMSVGFADNLVGRGESVPAEFTFRASGGKSIKDGAARIKRIKGNSVVWNQKVDGELRVQDGTMSQSGDRYTITPTGEYAGIQTEITELIQGHKYICLCSKVGGSKPLYLNWGGYDSLANAIFEVTNVNKVNCTFYAINENEVFTLTRPIICDLTQMFQAGNEPSTIEKYNARKPIVADEYAYNEGEVIHMNTESIKSVGDNAWDEQWEVGGIYTNNGESFDIDHNIRSKDYNRIIGGQEYSFLSAQTGTLILYDEHYNYVDYWNIAEGQLRVLTIADNAAYFKICLYDYTYKNGTMLRLNHSGWKSETGVGYEPYWQDILPLPIIRKYFPDGMKSAGSAHDEIRYNKASGKWEKVVRIGSVDMSQFGWYQGSGFWASWNSKEFMADMKKPSDNGEVANICCKKYVAGSWTSVYEATEGNIAMYSDDGRIGIADSSIQSDADIMAATQGIILYYELAEPVIREIDEPFGTDYRVADFGTEQAVSSIPSAPFSADIIYQFNAVDMIRENYNEIEKIKAALAKAGITIDL